jgi:hypothetical protein
MPLTIAEVQFFLHFKNRILEAIQMERYFTAKPDVVKMIPTK